MKGITLLKNIQKGKFNNDDEFVYHNPCDTYNKCIVRLDSKTLYFDIFGQRFTITTDQILNGTFIKQTSQDELYEQAINRVCKTHHICEENDFKSIIIALEKEIDYYRNKTKKLMNN